jgi:hypothetical protein
MHWTTEYLLQSGAFLLLWILAGSAVAVYTHRRDR